MNLETATFWLAAMVYAAATLLFVGGLVFGRERLVAWGLWFTFAAFAAQTVSIATRWSVTGRLPYVQDYENALSGTWAIVLAFLVLAYALPRARSAGVFVLPFVLLTMGYGLLVPAEAGPVTPAYRSSWLIVHVVFAWATYAAYVAAASLAGIDLLRATKRFSQMPRLPLIPAPGASREVIFKLVAFGFIVNSVMIASGAIWAYELWGSYWRWDPVETWSLLTWLAYAFYLHAYLTLGWRDKKLAWIAFFALFGVMMTFWGVQLVPSSYHLFRDIGSFDPDMGRGR